MLLEKRATRGLRMNELVGAAVEEDAEFWNNELWKEGDDSSEEGSFVLEEQEDRPDQFDSDFNDSETDEDDNDSENESKNAKRTNNTQQKVKTNVYKDPSQTTAAMKRAMSGGTAKPKQPSQRLLVSLDLPVTTGEAANRTVRDSTKAKSVGNEMSLKAKAMDKLDRPRAKTRESHVHKRHCQRDLLMEALDTEDANQKWILAQRVIDPALSQSERPVKGHSHEAGYIRYTSRRGTYNTVTFSSVDSIPSVLRSCSPPVCPARVLCVITNLPARYKDPMTQLPYATAEAFKEIRRRHSLLSSGHSPHRRPNELVFCTSHAV